MISGLRRGHVEAEDHSTSKSKNLIVSMVTDRFTGQVLEKRSRWSMNKLVVSCNSRTFTINELLSACHVERSETSQIILRAPLR